MRSARRGWRFLGITTISGEAMVIIESVLGNLKDPDWQVRAMRA
jgi:hypothetical protein